jgi:uncharacterized protein (TIGR02391 family)
MILTDDEIRQIRRSIEIQAGLDETLMQRCGPLIHMGRFDEAVRSAFVLLEERLRKAVNEEGMTGTQLANFAFSPAKGPLAKHLGSNQAEREGLRELFSGAFKLFRNPTAHGMVGYTAAEGKAIIGLVDLMLKMLKRAEELPPPDTFPDYLEAALARTEENIGPGATSRLRLFLGKCITQVGLKPATGKQWVPFKRYALYQPESWDQSKPHSIGVFYLISSKGRTAIHFSIRQYYSNVVGFNVDRLVEELAELHFIPVGKDQEPRVDLQVYNDQPFFDALFDVVVRVAEELGDTLQQE